MCSYQLHYFCELKIYLHCIIPACDLSRKKHARVIAKISSIDDSLKLKLSKNNNDSFVIPKNLDNDQCWHVRDTKTNGNIVFYTLFF